MPQAKSRAKQLVGVAIAGAAALGAMPGSASAAASCPVLQTTQIFADLGDPNQYFVAPGGAFEAGDVAWKLAGAASVAKRDAASTQFGLQHLSLGSGGSAVSPPVCIDSTRTHLRAGAVAKGGTLKVEALVDGKTFSLSSLAGSGFASPRITDFVPLAAPIGVHSSITKWVKLKVTAVGGAWTFDGVAVDPRSSR